MNTPRKHPRTLSEAFGPHTSQRIEPMREDRHWTTERIALTVTYAFCLVVLAVVI